MLVELLMVLLMLKMGLIRLVRKLGRERLRREKQGNHLPREAQAVLIKNLARINPPPLSPQHPPNPEKPHRPYSSKKRKSTATAAADPAPSTAEEGHLVYSQMKTGDKIWLLESILSHAPASPADIPWETIESTSPHASWAATGLARAFGKIVKRGIGKREREGLGVVEGVERLLGELGELPQNVREERWTGNGEGGGGDNGEGRVDAEGEEHLRDAVQLAMEQIKEREETEKLARVLLSQVQEAYGN